MRDRGRPAGVGWSLDGGLEPRDGQGLDDANAIGWALELTGRHAVFEIGTAILEMPGERADEWSLIRLLARRSGPGQFADPPGLRFAGLAVQPSHGGTGLPLRVTFTIRFSPARIVASPGSTLSVV